MSDLFVINDIHAGVIRTAGVTPATQWALRLYVLEEFRKMLQQCDNNLLINGDLFDTANVPMYDLIEVFKLLLEWLAKGHMLYLAAGNHDLSKNSTVLSSFQALCQLLKHERVIPVFEPHTILSDDAAHWVHIIPHMPNQDLFDEAIAVVPASIKYLFLHCNYDNKFAMEKDHSLNLSPEQARKLDVERIIVAHEHQASAHQAGKIHVTGNQIPTSIADCLGNKVKFMTHITGDKLISLPVWEAAGSFARMDWQELVDDGAQFVRVQGSATAAQASAVISAISKFRSKSSALVITNAVDIEGIADMEQLQMNQETTEAFDVLGAVLKLLSPDERVVVERIVKEHNVQ